MRLFIYLGLHVHPDKCILILSQEILMLGFLINSLLMIVKLPLEKKERMRDACRSCTVHALPSNVLQV